MEIIAASADEHVDHADTTGQGESMSNESHRGCGCSTKHTERVTIGARPAMEATSPNHITVKIDGMTCGHCVSSVTEEISAVPGVSNVEVALVVDGTSTATVTTDTAIEESALEAAVAEAGYSLASIDD